MRPRRDASSLHGLLTAGLVALAGCNAEPPEPAAKPLPDLAIDYLQTDGGQPRPASDYNRHQVTEVLPEAGSEALFFNSAPRRKLLQVRLVGEEIVFAPGEDGHVLNDYHGDQNLQSLLIEARRVVLKAPLHLPGTDVQIYAETLEFVDSDPEHPALIDTSPVPLDLPPAADAERATDGGVARHGEDGADGESAGDIYLIVKEVQRPDAPLPVMFVTAGGARNRSSAGTRQSSASSWSAAMASPAARGRLMALRITCTTT